MNARTTARVAVVAVLATSVGLTAQQQAGQAGGQQGPPGADTLLEETELVFEREVFDYPEFARRNPFRPLVGTGAGPRFESMSLGAIIYSSQNPSESVVLMRAGGGGDTPAQTERLRVGESWGNVTVLEIRRGEVVLEVLEFGITEQRIMQLPTRGQGGS